jgi:4'-phosphopantetheinyl transferase
MRLTHQPTHAGQALMIADNDIHLWFVFSDQIYDTSLLSGYEALLTPEERIQQQRFYFHSHRIHYLISRALIRTTLSLYAEVEPHEWRFSRNPYGRPEIEWPRIDCPLRFNISHTCGLMSLAVTLQRDIGVDSENTTCRQFDFALAERFFAPDEVSALKALAPLSLSERFFEFWTLKEAYIKARGMGLSIPLDQFSFHLEDDAPLGISFDPRFDDFQNNWSFWLLQPTPRHKAALALRIEPWETVNLICRKTIPLRQIEPYNCVILRSSFRQPYT